ncbi:MAG: ATP-binding cassette domain-containing protein [Clostridia bacterium]|nr:ATP-binding cassette domain-containing protein [Clostridia bacterium]
MIINSTPTPFSSFSATGGFSAVEAYLLIFTDTKKEIAVVKLNRTMSLGRQVTGNEPDIAIDSPIVSRKHGEFSTDGTNFYYRDVGSFNGTFINDTYYNEMVNPTVSPVRLKDGDVIRFDCLDAKNSHENAVTVVFSTDYDKRSKWRRAKALPSGTPIGVSNMNLLEIGENAQYTYIIATPSVTGCSINNVAHIGNLMYRNNPVAERCRLRNKDVFRIGQSNVFYDKNEFIYNICLATEPGLDIHLSETTVPDNFGKKVLLKDIHLSIDKGDFALIIGGSGAGKSTFMNSILGKYDITGQISIEGRQSTDSNDLTSGIAYVPQTLPLRKEERLLDVVTDTCILRCQRPLSGKERKQFIMSALESVGLAGKAKMEIKKLSGGEQRRAAIANEIVTDAGIFFLDEPDSGLDPKSGMELMHNLKSLSDKGKIVMLISHNYASYPGPENIYTKVIILAKSNRDGIGRLAFCGSVKEALDFFGVSELKDITKLINPVSENGEGRADEFVEKFRRMY